MLFNSLPFLIFFIITYTVYIFYRNNYKIQNLILLGASIVFYGFWSWKFIVLLLFTSSVDYWAGFKIYHSTNGKYKKLILTISVATNLIILGFFKYFNFFVHEFNSFTQLFGLTFHPVTLSIILPLGISFYTFQSISYAWEIYRGENKPIHSIFDYWLFVAFFPHMIAGPIQKGKILIPQIINPRVLTLDKFYEGCYLIFWGLFKKMYVADSLAVYANRLFAQPLGGYTWVDVVLGVWIFAFQIYCDFSGYTDIARGLAKLMGFDFTLNFNLPYFAKSPSEFWKRWHISLSTWLKDFLYIPLGGNRKGKLLTYRNLFLTMLIGGLWHGASNHFLLWGAYQGFLLCIHKLWHETMSKFELYNKIAKTKLYGFIAISATFFLTCYGWLIFRANSVTQLVDMTRTVWLGLGKIGTEFLYPANLVNVIWLLFIIQLFQYFKKDLNGVFNIRSWQLRGFVYLLILFFIGKGINNHVQQFIYFQF